MAAVDLGKQIGPLPLGAWIAVVGGGLGIAYYTKNSGGGGTTDAGVVDDTSTPDGTGDGTVGGWTPTQPGQTNMDSVPTTNEEWGTLAINWLIAQGYDPAWAYSAITKALEGGRGDNKLSAREYSLWRAALRHLGAPPTPITIPPPGPIPAPIGHGGGGQTVVIGRHEYVARTPDTGKCKRCGHAKDNFFFHYAHQKRKSQPGANSYTYARVTVPPLPGSTLRSLAVIYYHDGSKWERIYHANRAGTRRADGTPGMIDTPERLHPGWKLIIPK